MAYIFSKIAGFFATPLSWIWLGVVLSMLLFFLQKKKAMKIILLVTSGITLIFTNPFLAQLAMHQWEKEHINFTNKLKQKKYEYGIVLSGMLTYDNQKQHVNYRESSDRIIAAANLFHSQKIKKIIITGGNASILKKAPPEALVLKNYLKQVQVPARKIITETQSRNTYEHAVYIKKMIQKGIIKDKPMLLITSAYHIKRARACFDKKNIKVIPYPVDFFAPNIRTDFHSLFVPTYKVLRKWELLWHEWLGVVYYKIQNYTN